MGWGPRESRGYLCWSACNRDDPKAQLKALASPWRLLLLQKRNGLCFRVGSHFTVICIRTLLMIFVQGLNIYMDKTLPDAECIRCPPVEGWLNATRGGVDHCSVIKILFSKFSCKHGEFQPFRKETHATKKSYAVESNCAKKEVDVYKEKRGEALNTHCGSPWTTVILFFMHFCWRSNFLPKTLLLL